MTKNFDPTDMSDPRYDPPGIRAVRSMRGIARKSSRTPIRLTTAHTRSDPGVRRSSTRGSRAVLRLTERGDRRRSLA
jgi:hypothetical protein